MPFFKEADIVNNPGRNKKEMEEVRDRLKLVKEKINRAAERSGRSAGEIELVAVTKTVAVARIREAIEAGVRNIGENRVQEALAKHEDLSSNPPGAGLPRWHMIGHLQRNKVERALSIFDLIHSVDSLSLAEEIDKRAEALGKRMDILVEVNVSGEESKFGLERSKVNEFLVTTSKLKNLRIQGLMTMTPFTNDPEQSRPYFRKLRCLSEEIQSGRLNNIEMRYLSMGMSQDFEVAIEEGANMVRIGSAIFGSRP